MSTWNNIAHSAKNQKGSVASKVTHTSRILTFLFSAVLTIACNTFAASEPNLRGRVMDWNNNPVSRAVVKLHGANLQVKTDLSGYFSFNSALPVKKKVTNTNIAPRIHLKAHYYQ